MEIVRSIRASVPNLSRKIRNRRIEMGLSAQALATKSGISLAYWYLIEKGARPAVSEEMLRRIEKALEIDFGVRFD